MPVQSRRHNQVKKTPERSNLPAKRSPNCDHTWTCPNSGEYGLLGYTIQRWIAKNADHELPIRQDGWAEIQIAHNQNSNYLSDGMHCFTYKGQLCVYTADFMKDCHRIFTNAKDSTVIADVQHSIRWDNPLRGHHLQVFSLGPRGNALEIEHRKPPTTDLEKVVIPPEVREELRDNTVFHLEHIKGDNGIILHGPPGTGKSLSCQALIRETLEAGYSSCYVVGRIDFEYFERMINRYLAPCLVILEDIDTYAQDRINSALAPFSDFLQFMSGLSEREEKIVIIATTNHLDQLDQAIAQRPVRFNRRFHIGLPDYAQTKALLDNYFKDSAQLPEDAAQLCQDAKFTGSHIAEVRRTAEILSKKTDRLPESCFTQAFNTVSHQFKTRKLEHAGFATA